MRANGVTGGRVSTPATAGSATALPKKSKSWLLRFVDRYGQDGRVSAKHWQRELAFRGDRDRELWNTLESVVQAARPAEVSLRRLHETLNHGKQWRGIHRLGALLSPRAYAAGNYRCTPQRGDSYVCPMPSDVGPLMRAFGRRLDTLLAQAKGPAEARLVGAWALTMMIRIHPFVDGNGRTARALVSFVLRRKGEPAVAFPADSSVYKASPVWQRFKDHMRGFVATIGWSARDGSIPPRGYFEKLRDLLAREVDTTSPASLAARPDIVALANAIAVAETRPA